MKLIKINVCIAIVFALINSSVAFAWNDEFTHPELTEAAVSYLKLNGSLVPYFQNNLGFNKNFDEMFQYKKEQMTIFDLLQKGSEQEDARDKDNRLSRSFNHFHNPLKPTDEAGLDQGIFQGESAFAWMRGTGEGCKDEEKCINNKYSWRMARQYYSKALYDNETEERESSFAETFRSLGQIIHLVQDMGVPAHTRNDSFYGHFSFKGIDTWKPWRWFSNNLEIFIERRKDLVAEYGANAELPSFSHPGLGEFVRLHYFWDTDNYTDSISDSKGVGLAEYASANFLSTATMYDVDNFPHPSKTDTENYPIDWSDPEPVVAEDNRLDQRVYLRKIDPDSGREYRLSAAGYLSRDYDNLDPENERWVQTTQLDERCHQDYAELLIPKAVGYSAGVLNYFFRGALEISAPDDYLYGITDATGAQPQFIEIKAKVKNISKFNNVPEAMGAGKVWAVAKYKIQNNFDRYLRDTTPWDDYDNSTAYSYSRSEKIAITELTDERYGLQEAHELTFDFSQDPVPTNISDLYLQVVFQGTIGAEPGNICAEGESDCEDEGAIAVGMKNLYEPTHFTLFNSTDYLFVCRDQDATLGTCPGFKTIAELEDDCPGPCNNCQGGPVLCAPRINDILVGVCPYPALATSSLYFYPGGEENKPPEPQIVYFEQPAGHHARAIILADNETGGESLSVSGTQDVSWPSEFCDFTGFTDSDSYDMEFELVLNRCESTLSENGTINQDCSTSLAEHRGLRMHSAGGIESSYGAYILQYWIPNDEYHIPTLEQLGTVVWPALPYDEPWASGMPDPGN